MKEIEIIITGIIIGISVSAPLGPIGALCLQRTLNRGRFVGFMSGLGASTADTLYAIIAGFGVSIIANFLDTYQYYFRLGGGIILLAMGIQLFMKNPIKEFRNAAPKGTLFGYFFSTFFLTISNPLTIIFFGAAFATFISTDSFINTSLLVTSVFAGAIIWWFILISITNIFRKRIRLRNLFVLNKITGIVIVIFSIVAIVSAFTL